MQKLLDLYSDYLLSTFDQATATGLSKLMDGAVSHDQVSRLLSGQTLDSKDLWQTVKLLVKQHRSQTACLIFDDSIIEKPYTDENPLICWHWDHTKQVAVKGINLLSAFYHSRAPDQDLPLRIPVAFELVIKTVMFSDLKTKKVKRKAEVTKNEMMRQMISQCIHNQLTFRYILADSWFSSADNMLFIDRKKKYFIFDLKSNRQAALSEKDRNQGHWTRIDQLSIADNTPVKVWLKDLKIPVLLTKQVFINKDQSTGVRFLVTNDFSLSDDDFTTLYKKRWSVEEYHKSLKQNAAISQSPTRTVNTQSNHLFASIFAYTKLEQLKFTSHMNHFAMKSKLYLAAIKAAFKELMILKNLQHATA
ncbi:MAG: transposase [Saprospiraceae bacterium]|nr:transposase [Saprospiraceae bacterium]